MAYEYHHRRRIHFQDTDAAGLIHFSNYFRFMEEAETEFLYRVAEAIGVLPGDEFFVTPRVAVSAEFFRPAKFGDVLDCHLWVQAKGRSSISYVVSFKRGEEGEEVARGRVKFVCVAKDESGKYRSMPIPEALDRAIQVAPFAETGEAER